MKHVGLYVLALVCIVFAGIVVWPNRTALTTGHLLFAGIFVLAAVLLAGGADARSALDGLADFARKMKGVKDASS